MRRAGIIFLLAGGVLVLAGAGFLWLQSSSFFAAELDAGGALPISDAATRADTVDILRPAAPPESPNVVLLILDTLRADRVGAHQSDAHEEIPEGVSRELDALAHGGVRFARAISQSSWTRPSIGSMLTSRYPRTLGIYVERDQVLGDEFVTLAEVLRENGYRTLGMTANPNINTVFNFHQGFDDYVDSGAVWGWMRSRAERRENTEPPTLPSAKDLFEGALARMEEMPDGPIYLQLDLMEAHEHYRPEIMLRSEFEELYSEREDAPYLRCVRQLSKDIGEFVEELRARPRFANTLLIITSDHGEGLESHPHVRNSRGHGRLVYDSQNWVPLILHHTQGRLPEQRVVSRQVRLLDLMPTLLDFLSIEGPEEMAGVSLMSLIADDEAEVDLPPFFVVETHFRGSSVAGLYGSEIKFAFHRRRHPGTNRREIQANFSYEDGRRTDLSGSEPEVRDAMARYLERWMDEHPRATPQRPVSEVSPEEMEQLRAIGYVVQ